jgi:hypothetical protein
MKFKILLSTALMLAASTSAWAGDGLGEHKRPSDMIATQCTIVDKAQVSHADGGEQKAPSTQGAADAGLAT